MPEYPAVRRLHHCLLQLQIVFSCLCCFCNMVKWGVGIKNYGHYIWFRRWSQQVVFQALCLRFYFGMDAFESTPLAFTSWLRSWRLVNCRVCNARGRMKGMQKLVMRSTRKGGFQLTCCSFTSWPPGGILHCIALPNHPTTNWWRLK